MPLLTEDAQQRYGEVWKEVYSYKPCPTCQGRRYLDETSRYLRPRCLRCDDYVCPACGDPLPEPGAQYCAACTKGWR